ncbi:hypothetical protein DQD29_01160 [Salmonella enterica subsp. salamae]|nr:hypothetical protein [Salmonella enterica subsp. salamae]
MTMLKALDNREKSLSIKWNRYPKKGIIVLGTADMDFQSPDCIRTALMEKAATGSYAYELKPESYYEAIFHWYSNEYQWNIDNNWLTNSPGMWALFHMCIQAFTDVGDNILIHSPHFHPAITAIKGNNRNVVTQLIDCDGSIPSVDMDKFESIIKEQNIKLFFLVNPHNPTGKVFTRDELTKISDVCEKYGVIVVSDEIHGLITYDQVGFVPYGSINDHAANHSVTLTSPSKAFNIQGLTYAIGIIPNNYLGKKLEMVRTWYDFDFATNIFSIAAVEAAYKNGKPWLMELNTYLQGNLDFMCQFCASNIPDLRVIRPQGGYMAWMDFRGFNISPQDLQSQILDKANVGLTWGDSFGHDGNGYERLNFGCPNSTLKKGLNNLAAVFSNR